MEDRMKDKAGKIGMMLFLMTEAMFFAGLISAYWILRNQSDVWPPIGQPRLPVVITGFNTLILLSSGVTMLFAERAVRKGCSLCLIIWLGIAGLAGFFFLALQGYEWVRLIHFGLTTVRNIYGGMFYMIVGVHAVHLIAALGVVMVVFLKSVQGRYSESRYAGVTLCRMYWIFVVGVWPVLYALIYF